MEGSVKNKITFINRGGETKQLSIKKIQLSCFGSRPLHKFYFFHCPVMPGVIVCRGHKQKVLALRFSVAMPKDG
jgi:hypothetical protein